MTGHEHILVIDDEPAYQFLLQVQLEKLGYQATILSRGEDAVAALQATHREGHPSPYDLVLVDMTMTPGMDGIETSRAIRQLYPDQKIVIFSGYVAEKHEEAIRQLGVSWMEKTVMPQDLAYVIRKQLNGGTTP